MSICLETGAIVDGIDLKSLDLKGVTLDITQAVALARTHGANSC
jgi:fluoroquinolone resistance protein